MASYYGKNVRVSVFGQSHSKAIGVTVDGLPAGKKVDMKRLQEFLNRRAPGKNEYSTARKEADMPEFLCGLVDDVTCGAPLTAVIHNNDTRSKDYSQIKDVPRPAHADYAAQIKFGGAQDVAGGGHFSGRLTAPLCIAGGICKQLLEKKGINITAHIYSIAGVKDTAFNDMTAEEIKSYAESNETDDEKFPVVDQSAGAKMREKISEAAMDLDSVGGIVECVVNGMPAGIGEPMFEGMENKIASAIFGIPAVKGIEFGNGFEVADLRGSENNDTFYMDNGVVRTETNNHGGILGGITSGMPILFRAAFKPTPSIAKEQRSISFSQQDNTVLQIKGRHDPCIVPRAVPVVEAVAAIAILDALMD